MSKQENDNQATLEDLAVTEVQADDTKGGVSINFARIEFEYKPQKSDGSLG